MLRSLHRIIGGRSVCKGECLIDDGAQLMGAYRLVHSFEHLVTPDVDALQSNSARSSVEWLFDHFSRQLYNPCNLLIADAREAFAIHYDSHQASMQILNPGLHLLADTDVDDPMHPRIQQARALLEELPADWPTLRDMLKSVMADHDKNLIPSDRICIHGERAGTLSSPIVALCERNLNQPEFHFADGPPCAQARLRRAGRAVGALRAFGVSSRRCALQLSA